MSLDPATITRLQEARDKAEQAALQILDSQKEKFAAT